MKFFLLTIILIFLTNCSFDTKSGIWNNSNENFVKKTIYEDFKDVNVREKLFDKIIQPPKNLKIELDAITQPLTWLDVFYNESNNSGNYTYKDTNKLIFKSKKVTKSQIDKKILFDGNNFIITDKKGNIIIFSTENKKVIYKFNFYKKKYKKISKRLFIKVENNIIFVTDNLGYIYALNYSNQKLLWAKNYKIPFRSNLKLFKNNIFATNQDNTLFIVNKYNGERLKSFPTEEVILKNNFINSLAIYKKGLFYLNTYGSLYSINLTNNKINWFINLNKSYDLNSNNLFYSNPIVINNNRIIISTDSTLYIADANNGRIIGKKIISSIVKPIISGDNVFLITDKNLLVNLNLNSGEIIYSLNISEQIAKFLDTKKKTISILSLEILNNELYVFLNNSYVVNFEAKGKIKKIDKLPSKISSFPIFINDSILFSNNKKRLVIVN